MKTLSVVLVVLGAVAAQETWTQHPTSVQPLPRHSHGMAYDAARQVVVLFGGWRYGQQTGVSNDTWEWDGTTWTERQPPVSPPARFGHAMVYDEARKVVVMFGGLSGSSSRWPDTWVYDGTTWTRVHTMPVNEERYSVAMAYDSLRKRIVRFGGGGAGGVKGDTWVWDGSTWTDLKLAGPPARKAAPLAYDSVRDRMVLFAGEAASGSHQDTWEFDGTRWIQRQPTAIPPARYRHDMAFHPGVARTIQFGGAPSNVAETWAWDGNDWTKRVTLGSPAGRGETPMVYDAARDRVMLFSGSSQTLADTWSYRATVRSPGSFVEFGAGCAGTAGTPKLAAGVGEVPFVGSPFRLEFAPLPTSIVSIPFGLIGVSKTQWGSIPLPLDLGPFLMPGCNLFVSHDWIQQLPKQGSSSTWILQVPYDTTLVGQRFYAQGVVADAKANGAGFVWSNAGEGLIGER